MRPGIEVYRESRLGPHGVEVTVDLITGEPQEDFVDDGVPKVGGGNVGGGWRWACSKVELVKCRGACRWRVGGVAWGLIPDP